MCSNTFLLICRVLFKTIPGWHWASYLVAVGAVIGVGTVVLVSIP